MIEWPTRCDHPLDVGDLSKLRTQPSGSYRAWSASTETSATKAASPEQSPRTASPLTWWAHLSCTGTMTTLGILLPTVAVLPATSAQDMGSFLPLEFSW